MAGNMDTLRTPREEPVYVQNGNLVIFNQLGVKIDMSGVADIDYFSWLDYATSQIGQVIPGVQIAEKVNARSNATPNITVYYDTDDYRLLSTGALLRTSCNPITHAFCAFKQPRDENGVRRDHRYVFVGEEKRTIQLSPTSQETVAIVRKLLSSDQTDNPGIFLVRSYGIKGDELRPALRIDNHRCSFYVWIDKRDGLRCSLDRAYVSNLRSQGLEKGEFGEVELSLYPRVDPTVAQDPRIVESIKFLADSVSARFATQVITAIKYQRAAEVLKI